MNRSPLEAGVTEELNFRNFKLECFSKENFEIEEEEEEEWEKMRIVACKRGK